MTEAELQNLVAELCAELRLLYYHTYDSRRSVPGFPDCVIVGKSVLFRELKSDSGLLHPVQRRWGSWIRRAGGDWCVWRPRDWRDGTIRRELLGSAPDSQLTPRVPSWRVL